MLLHKSYCTFNRPEKYILNVWPMMAKPLNLLLQQNNSILLVISFIETSRGMRKEGETWGNGPPIRIRFPTFDGCYTAITSRSHGSRLRRRYARRNQSTVLATHEIHSSLVLSGSGGTWNVTSYRNGSIFNRYIFWMKIINLLDNKIYWLSKLSKLDTK